MNIIKYSLKEDIGKGDITTNATVPKSTVIKAEIIAKEQGVIAGLDIAKKVFNELDKKIVFKKKVKDGAYVKNRKIIVEIKGNARAILTGERVALNFLQRLSGIATLTRKFVEAGKGIKILDTRKTTPGMRKLEKYAVKVGGGNNHRFGLYDAILIKDNHIESAGGIENAIKMARKRKKKIEIEVKNIKEVKKALYAKADTLLLDNMDIKTIKKAVKLAKGNAKTEISGGVNLKNMKRYSKTGADFVSIGALTHSSKALDLSLNVLSIL